MDQRNFAIGVLSTTAVVLFVGLLLVNFQAPRVLASGMSASGGEYTMTVGTFAQNDEEFVYVIKARSEKLAVYRFDASRKEIQIVDGVDLKQMRAAASGGSAQPGRGGRP